MEEHVTISISRYDAYEKQSEEIKDLEVLMSEKKVIKVFQQYRGSHYLSYDDGISEALDVQKADYVRELRDKDDLISEIKEQNKSAAKAFHLVLGILTGTTLVLLALLWITSN